MSYNLRYRRQKLKSKNFRPIIQFYPFQEEKEEPIFEEPPIDDLVILDEEDNVELLDELVTELKKIKNIRKLELWISKNRNRVKKLGNNDMDKLLDFISHTFYTK